MIADAAPSRRVPGAHTAATQDRRTL